MYSEIQQDPSWMPVNCTTNDDRTLIEWRHVGDTRFDAPFFEDSYRQLRITGGTSRDIRHLPLESLTECPPFADSLPPSGFIYHLSRCGSTLASQMLATSASRIVISEASPIDAAIRAEAHGVAPTDEVRSTWIRRIIEALGRPRFPGERQYFVKFDSWSIRHLDRIRAAFPRVPWILLYREPGRILRSQTRMPGMHMVPGILDPELFGINRHALFDMSMEQYAVAVLRALFTAAVHHYQPGQARLLNYADLPDAFIEQCVTLFKIESDTETLEKMKARVTFDAKTPGLHFQKPGAPSKLPEAFAPLVKRELSPLYQRLETLRTADM